MNTKGPFLRYVLPTVLILLSVLGIHVANRTYQYEGIVKGIQGVAVLYLLFYYIRHSKLDAPIDTMLADPKTYKYLFYAFIGPGIANWAMRGILEMISLLIKTLGY